MAEEPQNNNAYWAANVRIILIKASDPKPESLGFP